MRAPTSEKPVDYYAILGVEGTATSKQIRSAYYRLALIWSPDKYLRNSEKCKLEGRQLDAKEAEEHFKNLNKAYDVLIERGSKANDDAIAEEENKARQQREQADRIHLALTDKVRSDINREFRDAFLTNGQSKEKPQVKLLKEQYFNNPVLVDKISHLYASALIKQGGEYNANISLKLFKFYRDFLEINLDEKAESPDDAVKKLCIKAFDIFLPPRDSVLFDDMGPVEQLRCEAELIKFRHGLSTERQTDAIVQKLQDPEIDRNVRRLLLEGRFKLADLQVICNISKDKNSVSVFDNLQEKVKNYYSNYSSALHPEGGIDLGTFFTRGIFASVMQQFVKMLEDNRDKQKPPEDTVEGRLLEHFKDPAEAPNDPVLNNFLRAYLWGKFNFKDLENLYKRYFQNQDVNRTDVFWMFHDPDQNIASGLYVISPDKLISDFFEQPNLTEEYEAGFVYAEPEIKSIDLSSDEEDEQEQEDSLQGDKEQKKDDIQKAPPVAQATKEVAPENFYQRKDYLLEEKFFAYTQARRAGDWKIDDEHQRYEDFEESLHYFPTLTPARQFKGGEIHQSYTGYQEALKKGQLKQAAHYRNRFIFCASMFKPQDAEIFNAIQEKILPPLKGKIEKAEKKLNKLEQDQKDAKPDDKHKFAPQIQFQKQKIEITRTAFDGISDGIPRWCREAQETPGGVRRFWGDSFETYRYREEARKKDPQAHKSEDADQHIGQNILRILVEARKKEQALPFRARRENPKTDVFLYCIGVIVRVCACMAFIPLPTSSAYDRFFKIRTATESILLECESDCTEAVKKSART